MPRISVVIPCYFNQENLPFTAAALLENEKRFSEEVIFEYVFVDDGSEDGTMRELLRFYKANPSRTKIVSLSENVGSYNAIFAGFEYVTGDCVVVTSADLQDPPELIEQMLQKWKDGSKVVLAVRERRNDPLSTRLLSSVFNAVLRKFGLRNLPSGGFDFCLFDQSLIHELKSRMKSGINGLLILLLVERSPSILLYEKRKREHGKSQWTFNKKLKLAINTLLFFLASQKGATKELYHIKKTHGI